MNPLYEAMEAVSIILLVSHIPKILVERSVFLCLYEILTSLFVFKGYRLCQCPHLINDSGQHINRYTSKQQHVYYNVYKCGGRADMYI